MTKVVVNACYGGFGLSPEGEEAYLARHGKRAFFYEHTRTSDGRPDFDNYAKSADPRAAFMTVTTTEDFGATATKEQVYPDEGDRFYDRDLKRDDPDLVAVVEELGSRADGAHAKLKVVEIPDDVEWIIEEYDGIEWVAEAHRTWS